jgi:large subunit ribosomal protein L23
MEKLKYYDIIKRPVLTEKSSAFGDAEKENSVYLFEVALKADKGTIKKAIEVLFDVKVKTVNTVIMRGKTKRVGKNVGKKSNWKKAYITLQKGSTINFVEEL